MPEKKTGPCGQCGKTLGDEFFCFGCKNFICEDHGSAPWGSHKVSDHLPDCDGCGEHPNNCQC